MGVRREGEEVPSANMTPHNVTLFNWAGEDDNGNAVYQKTTLTKVYTRMKQGVAFGNGNSGTAPNEQDELIVYVFDESSKTGSKTYIHHTKWNAESDKTPFWTVRDDGKDLLVIGICDQETPPTNEQTFKATRATRREAGNKRMWHWEVHCT